MSTGRNTQVTTWRRFTAAEKKAYRARVRRRQEWFIVSTGQTIEQWFAEARKHHFADGLGTRVPTMRVNGERL